LVLSRHRDARVLIVSSHVYPHSKLGLVQPKEYQPGLYLRNRQSCQTPAKAGQLLWELSKRRLPAVSQDDIFSGKANNGQPPEEGFARPRMTSNSFEQLNRGLVSNSIFKQGSNTASSPPSQPSPRASRFQSTFSPSAGMTESSYTSSRYGYSDSSTRIRCSV